jgi:hypothetical protein
MVGAVGLALIVVGGPVAGNASAAELDSFSGMGTGFALRVIVDLSGLRDTTAALPLQQAWAPIAAASGGKLPAEFPYVIDQKLIQTLADMGATSKAQSLLGTGFVNFSEVAEVTAKGEKKVVAQARKLPSDAVPILDVSAGELIASIADGPKVASDGTLARVAAQLDAVVALLPAELRDALEQALDALQTEINAAVATANTTLDETLGEVGPVLSETTGPVQDLLGGALPGVDVADPDALTSELQEVVNLPEIVDSLLEGELASVRGLDNDATSANSGGKVVSTATSQLLGAQALGLVNVGLVNLKSVSQAAGVKGSATNDSECSVADVRIGDDNGVSFDGKALYVNGTAVPVPTDQVDAVLGVAKDVLGTAGVSVETCDVAQADADADGTSAAQRVSAFRIEIAPKAVADVAALGISAGDELFKIVVDPTVETAAAAQVAAAPVVEEETPSLPRTGAAPMATILVGAGLAGAALFARRRFS